KISTQGYYLDLHMGNTIRVLYLELAKGSLYSPSEWLSDPPPPLHYHLWLRDSEVFAADLDTPKAYCCNEPCLSKLCVTILHYIAQKYNLCSEMEEEHIQVDVLENHIMDIQMQLVHVCYNPNFEIIKIECLHQLPGQLKLFSLFLGKCTWFAGNKITYVDFLKFLKLKEFLHWFESLSSISTYLAFEHCQLYPIFTKMACWGNPKFALFVP
uniref:glutathione transferase n=1 Tax=Monodelphis domestica TaxID=13616 RepID=A0A5F8GV39_MONDO